MGNSNEKMRREFEQFCKDVHQLHGPFLRDCNDPEPEREYQLFETQNLWERWQAAHTSAAEKYEARIKELEAENFKLAAGICHNAKGDEYGNLRCGADEKYKPLVDAANLIEKWMQKHCMSNPYVAGFKKQVLSKLRQALANLEQEQNQ